MEQFCWEPREPASKPGYRCGERLDRCDGVSDTFPRLLDSPDRREGTAVNYLAVCVKSPVLPRWAQYENPTLWQAEIRLPYAGSRQRWTEHIVSAMTLSSSWRG